MHLGCPRGAPPRQATEAFASRALQGPEGHVCLAIHSCQLVLSAQARGCPQVGL